MSTHCIELQEESVGFVFYSVRVGEHLHHGVEVLRTLQGRPGSIPAVLCHRDQELSATRLLCHLVRQTHQI